MNNIVLVLIKHFKRIHPCAHICKKGIHKSYGSHGLHNDHGAWNDDWIMAAFDAHINFFPIFIDSLLGGSDGWCRLDRGAQDNVTSVAHSA